jgi:hypothetical protein
VVAPVAPVKLVVQTDLDHVDLLFDMQSWIEGARKSAKALTRRTIKAADYPADLHIGEPEMSLALENVCGALKLSA